jgi:uncharacterized protein
MKCRDCQTELRCNSGLGATYHVCSRCGGVWFNNGELEHFVRQKGRIAFENKGQYETPAPEDGVNECPHCSSGVRLMDMSAFPIKGLRMQGCPVCFGRWFSYKQARVLSASLRGWGPFKWVFRLFS